MTHLDRPGAATAIEPDLVDRLWQKAAHHRYEAEAVASCPVRLGRMGLFTVHKLLERIEQLRARIDADEAVGSLRHRRQPLVARVLVRVLVLVDLALMFWFVSSVFNVDWSDPVGVPLAASAGFTVLATVGAVFLLDKAGRTLRDFKDDRRHLDWSELHSGGRAAAVVAAAIVVVLAAVMAGRIFLEGLYGGDSAMAAMLALCIGLVMLAANAWVCWCAFLDGSVEQEDLDRCTRAVTPMLRRRRHHQQKLDQVEREMDVLRRRARRGAPWAAGPAPRPLPPPLMP